MPAKNEEDLEKLVTLFKTLEDTVGVLKYAALFTGGEILNIIGIHNAYCDSLIK